MPLAQHRSDKNLFLSKSCLSIADSLEVHCGYQSDRGVAEWGYSRECTLPTYPPTPYPPTRYPLPPMVGINMGN